MWVIQMSLLTKRNRVTWITLGNLRSKWQGVHKYWRKATVFQHQDVEPVERYIVILLSLSYLESVAVPVHIFWQNFKNCKKPVQTNFEPCTLKKLIALDYSSKMHQRSPKMVKKWMRYGQHNLRWLFCQHSMEIWWYLNHFFTDLGHRGFILIVKKV